MNRKEENDENSYTVCHEESNSSVPVLLLRAMFGARGTFLRCDAGAVIFSPRTENTFLTTVKMMMV